MKTIQLDYQVIGLLLIIIILICLINKVSKTGLLSDEGFEAQIEMNEWLQEEKLARAEYLNSLIRADYTQSYPWMAGNPGGSTSFNKALFNQSSQQQIYTRRPQTYYDFGEITYIGNPL